MDGTSRPSEQQMVEPKDVFVNWTLDSNYMIPFKNSLERKVKDGNQAYQ